jgi:hypothetical protein
LNANQTAAGPTYALVPASGIVLGAPYTLTGPGGALVGPFSITSTYLSSFRGANWDSIISVDRSKPLTFMWTGSGFDQVYIQVNSVTTTGSTRRIVTMNCYVPAAPGTHTIPAEALSYLPAVPASGTSFGSIALEAQVPGTGLTASLLAGGPIDIGAFAIDVGYVKNVALQ